MKKLTVLLVLTLCVSLLFCACNSEPEEKTPTYSRITLVFQEEDICLADGTVGQKEAWQSTSAVELDDCYGIRYELAAQKDLLSVAFYDADGNFISGIGTKSMLDICTTINGFAVRPENAKTAKFLHFMGKADLPDFDSAFVEIYPTQEDYELAYSKLEYPELEIACLGDSLTEGDHGGTASGVANRSQKNYPYFLSRYLGCQTINYGRCGANTSSFSNGIYGAGMVDISESDVVLLMLGTNYGIEPDTNYYREYIRLIDKIQKDMKEGAKLILITPPSVTIDMNRVNYGVHPWVASAFNGVHAAAKEKGLPVIDAYRFGPIQPAREDEYQSNDGLHMNEAGCDVFARYIANELKKML